MKPARERATEAVEIEDLPGAPTLGVDGPPPTIDELVAEGDPEKLLELGAAYRVGTPHVERDHFAALECFEAASRLGSADAEYLAGVAFMDGIGIASDLAEGAKRLRSAAQRGSTRAKVYVANLYEMGVYYQADREKADVWYRNVARAANIEAEPETHEHDVAMAELGCVRHCLKLVADDALPAKDRAFYLKKAKAMGYAHRLAMVKRESSTPPETKAADPEPSAEAAPEPKPDPKPEPQQEAKQEPKPAEPEAEEDRAPLLGAQWTWIPGLLALLAATFFVTAASAAGWLSMVGSRALAQVGRPLPYVNGAHEAVFWAVVLVLGVLPATTAYRARVVLIGALAGAAGGAGAYYAWEAQHLLWDRLAQTAAGGLGLFLLVLFFLGVLGGTRARVAKKRPRHPRRA